MNNGVINTKVFIERYLKIRDKRAQLIDFKMNAAQMKLYDAIAEQYRNGKPIRAIIPVSYTHLDVYKRQGEDG